MTIKYKTIQRVNPRDVDAPKLFYPQLIGGKKCSERELLTAISDKTEFNYVKTFRIMSILFEHVVEEVLRGNTVQIDGLGTFYIALKSEGQSTKNKFDNDCITDVSITFVTAPSLKKRFNDAKFEKVDVNCATLDNTKN